YNFQTYVHCLDGRDEVKRLKDAFDYCICDSEYNKQELLDFGYSCQIDVVPILIPFEDYQKTPDAGVIEKYKGKKGKNILFTGRVAPNKKHEDLIHAFSLYRKQYDEDARLFIVGRHMDNPTYYAHLVNYIEENHFENIYFSDHVSFAEILAYYKIADLFLCMSEHEGFCVPLVEAMMFDIPVLAYDEGAIRYTMGDSGIVFEEKNFPEVASLMHLVLEDEELKKEIIARQRKRVEDFHPEKVGKEMLHAIEKFLAKEVKR
ncbi:MAG: glycosyltransferase, partial [Solobacterium sp.]|nr:glycosyltransferase [Solobacterium sp.]